MKEETSKESPCFALTSIELLDVAVNNAQSFDEIRELLRQIEDAARLLRAAKKELSGKLKLAKKPRTQDAKYADVLKRVASGETMRSIAKDKNVAPPVITQKADHQLYELNRDIACRRPPGIGLYGWLKLNREELDI